MTRRTSPARSQVRADRKSSAGTDGPTPGSLADQAAEADPDAIARAICLRQLTVGPRSRADLARAMSRRGVAAETAQRVLDRFEEVGLVDDAAFAEVLVRSRHAGRGLARRAVALQLQERGIDAEVADAALDVVDDDAERKRAAALVERRLGATRGLDSAKRKQRLVGMLARKGYPAGLAYAVVRAALEREGCAEDGDGGEWDEHGG